MQAEAAPGTALRRGWTTGACATAAAKAACQAFLGQPFPSVVRIDLPHGISPSFALAWEDAGPGWAAAGVIKDAGDDPDVTHGALVRARVSRAWQGSGVRLSAGEGVGIVTQPGLPIAPGLASITPVPRSLIESAVRQVCAELGAPCDLRVEISIPGGRALAQRTWNPRLGILGGLSILGTTGVVVPYSCSAWIHSIHRGVDVARAAGLSTLAGATGRASEQAVQAHFELPDAALIDMGDFAGALLKYVRKHPVERLIIAGGFAKLAKLAQGHLDLHSARSQLDLAALAPWVEALGGEAAKLEGLNSGAQVLEHFGHLGLGNRVAQAAKQVAARHVSQETQLSVLVCTRAGEIVGEA